MTETPGTPDPAELPPIVSFEPETWRPDAA